MKVSLVSTVYNEANSIINFLESINRQTQRPDEVIIVDGGSKDDTAKLISEFKTKSGLNIKLILKKGNRSVGRNEAIKQASNEIIAITDAGNILDKNWLKNIVKPFVDKKTEVVSGYYKGVSENIFQKCLIPFVLVMPDKAKPEEEFLPATRSMAIKKSLWGRAGGFNEKLSHNEDYAFASKLKAQGVKFHFVKNAIVNWIPRQNLRGAFIMFFRFALGDSEAKIFRDKVVYIFLRYLFGIYLLILSVIMRSVALWILFLLLCISYLGWAIQKNYKYVNNPKAYLYLPLLQITSDIAIMTGTVSGVLKNLSLNRILRLFLNNKAIIALIFLYSLVMLSVINWGIPNVNHPFDYQMDEWHQSQSVRELFRHGVVNVAGTANGTIFQFFLTGIFLIPFYILGIVNPFVIKSSVLYLDIQQRLFEVLRFNTLMFGILSIILIYYLSKKYFKVNGFLIAFLFTVNPLWLMLSNYFKYDISLMFWILLSLLFLLRYINNPKTLNFILASIIVGLAFSVKVSAIPFFPILLISFFIFNHNLKNSFKTFFTGIFIFLFISVFFGIPDLIFNKGNLMEYLFSNFVRTPNYLVHNIDFGMNMWVYFLTRIYPIDFGKPLYLLFILSIFSLISLGLSKLRVNDLFVQLKNNKNLCILFVSFIFFALSLYPLQTGAVGNRMLVLLPFIAIICGIFLTKILLYKNNTAKLIVISVIAVLCLLQVSDSYKYFRLKIEHDPRITSSKWIINNLKPGLTIGLENIPIYQNLPDAILKDFYLQQYGYTSNRLFNYKVISYKDRLPNIIIISDENLEPRFWFKSDKKDLLEKIKKGKFRAIKKFEPDFRDFPTLRDRFDLSLAGLIPIPDSIAIYEK